MVGRLGAFNLKKVLEDRFSVTMSRGGIGHMVNRWGFSYTRPSYTLKRTDKKRQTSFTQQLNALKNASDEVVFLYEDGSRIRDYKAPQATWSAKNKQETNPDIWPSCNGQFIGLC